MSKTNNVIDLSGYWFVSFELDLYLHPGLYGFMLFGFCDTAPDSQYGPDPLLKSCNRMGIYVQGNYPNDYLKDNPDDVKVLYLYETPFSFSNVSGNHYIKGTPKSISYYLNDTLLTSIPNTMGIVHGLILPQAGTASQPGLLRNFKLGIGVSSANGFNGTIIYNNFQI